MIKLPFDLKAIDLKKNPKKAAIIYIGAFLAGLALYFSIFFLPQIGRMTALLSRAGSAAADLKNAESDIARMDELKRTIDGYRNKVEIYEKRLPSEEEIPSLLESLSRMAGASNIQIVGITPVTVPGKDVSQMRGKAAAYKEIPITISAKSGYHDLGRFLSDLESADRFMKVVDIDIKANRATPAKHDFELVICTYILLKGK